MDSEKGQALPLAIMALAFGALVIAPFLGYAGSSLTGSRLYGQGITEFYSCDSGIEHAIWGLQSGELEVPEGETEILPEFVINSKTVSVSVENQGSQIYMVIATATSEDSHSTTIESYVQVRDGYSIHGDLYIGKGETYPDSVSVDGDITLGQSAKIEGDAYATGSITLGKSSEVDGDAYAGSDITLGQSAKIKGDAHANGVMTLGKSSEVEGNACAGSDIDLKQSAKIKGDVRITGDNTELALGKSAEFEGSIHILGIINLIELKQSATIKGDVYVMGNINSINLGKSAKIEGGGDPDFTGVYATGDIGEVTLKQGAEIIGGYHPEHDVEAQPYPDPPECPEMPLSDRGVSIMTWE